MCLVVGVKKWEGWKILLFGWGERLKDRKCSLYKFILMPLLHNM